jgi:hypothetical protein
MSFTAAFIILAIGIAIGYLLPIPVAKLKQFYRRHTFKPTLLRPKVFADRRSKVAADADNAATRHKKPPHGKG